MVRSLAIAVITFLGLGIYYSAAPRTAVVEADPAARKNARSAALSGVNVAKEALAMRWEGARHAGRQQGATYRVATLIRGESSSITSVGTVERRSRVVVRHQIRVGLVRRALNTSGAPGSYEYVVRTVNEPGIAEQG